MSMPIDQRYDFFIRLLEKLKLSPTANRMEFLLCWAAVENTRAKNNPLATTWDMKKIDPGQTNFNSVPVRNYSSQAIGVQATANTIATKRGYYKTIHQALKDNASIHSLPAADAILTKEFKTWGGTPGYWQIMKKIAAGSAGAKIAEYVKKKSTQTAGQGFGTALMILAAAWILSGAPVKRSRQRSGRS